MKFVSAKKPVDYANQLLALQKKIAKRRADLRELESEAELLQAYLRRSYPEGFAFAEGKKEWELRVRSHERQILDQGKAVAALAKLGKRIPYNQITVHQVSVVPKEEA